MALRQIVLGRFISGRQFAKVCGEIGCYVKGEERDGYFDVDSLYCLYRFGMDGTQLFAGEIGLDVLHEHARLFMLMIWKFLLASLFGWIIIPVALLLVSLEKR